jgi:hypothetical protein
MSIINAILKIDPNAKVTVDGSIDRIIWHDGNPNNITKEQILVLVEEFKQETERLRKIQADKGSTLKQLEFITENGLEAWQAKVQEIESKY